MHVALQESFVASFPKIMEDPNRPYRPIENHWEMIEAGESGTTTLFRSFRKCFMTVFSVERALDKVLK